MQCPSCGATNKPGAHFCCNCRYAFPTSSNTLRLTTVLQGRYVVQRLIGVGGMSAVYQMANQRLGGKMLALKEMSDAAIVDPAERARAIAAFQQEAQLLARLDHPNIPKVSDYFSENGKYYIVMDFVQGETLEQALAKRAGPCSETEVREWARQLCDVLAYLHGQTPPIIFRDLKPSNIMLTPQGQIKLIDFGIARVFKSGKASDTLPMGTEGYASPEHYGKSQTDTRSDIYSLGVVLHHLLTRYDPASTPLQLPPARQLNPQVSVQLEQAIVTATQPDMTYRYASLADFGKALGLSGGGGGGGRVRGVAGGGGGSHRGGEGVPVWVFGLVLAVVAAVFFFLQKPAPRPVGTPAASMPVVVTVPVDWTQGPTPVATATLRPSATPQPGTAVQPPTEAPAIPAAEPAAQTADTPVSSPTEDPRPAIADVVQRFSVIWLNSWTQVDGSQLPEVLVDPVLLNAQEGLCYMRNNHYHYEYRQHNLAITEVQLDSDTQATVFADISDWRLLVDANGNVVTDFKPQSYQGIYILERRGDQWFINCLTGLFPGDPIECTLDWSTPDPCQQ
jgi:serine/threonine protein kinase